MGPGLSASAWLSVAVALETNCQYQKEWAQRRHKTDDQDSQYHPELTSLSMSRAQRIGSGYTEWRTPVHAVVACSPEVDRERS